MTTPQPETIEAPDAAALPAAGPPSVRHPSAAARHLGFVSLVVTVALVALEAVAIAVGAERHWVTATVLAWIVIVGTAATFVVAVFGIVRRRDRWLAIVAAVLSVIANPLLLIVILNMFGAS